MLSSGSQGNKRPRADGQDDKYERVVADQKERLPDEDYNNLVINAKRLGKKIEQLMRTRERKKRHLDKIEQLEKGHIPNGCRPFSLPEIPENDLPVGLQGFTIHFTADWSIRQAREAVHRGLQEFVQRCDKKVAEYQEQKLNKEVAYNTFIESIVTTAKEKAQNFAELDIDFPDGLFDVSTAITKDKATELYKKILMYADDSIKKERDEAQKEKDMETKEVAKLNELNEADLFHKAVQQAVQKSKGKGKGQKDPKGKGKGKQKGPKEYEEDLKNAEV